MSDDRTKTELFDLLLDARSQFIAFASVVVARCGGGSQARVLSTSIVQHLGREWMVSCCWVTGLTVGSVARVQISAGTQTTTATNCSSPIHLFVGLSPTLGVVWHRCWNASQFGDTTTVIDCCIGGDKFVVRTTGPGGGMSAFVADAKTGSFVRRLVSDWPKYQAPAFDTNGKWLVMTSRSAKDSILVTLIIWPISHNGDLLGSGVKVKFTITSFEFVEFPTHQWGAEELVCISIEKREDRHANLKLNTLRSRTVVMLQHPRVPSDDRLDHI
ncbi:hypothetical protein Pelo_16202 [Pelomyxa schiedti]|nr:hypothetical protein Pelo_16202 [Pelomyxa schiedti]